LPLNVKMFLGESGVSGFRNMFDKKANEHADSQSDNPFSDWKGAGTKPKRLSKDDPNYGRPLPGSKSEKRAQAAQQHIMMEIKYCVDMVWDCAEWRSPDGRGAITFGRLFNIYIAISDKVVGTLLRARKHGYVTFEGEMLYQRRDEDKIIKHTRPYNTIRARFGQKPLTSGGGAVEPWDPEEPILRRNSVDTNTQLLTDKTPRRNSMPPGMTPHGSSSKKNSKEEKTEEIPGIVIECDDSASSNKAVPVATRNKSKEEPPKTEFLLPNSAGSVSPRRARSLTPCRRMSSMDELDAIEEDHVDDMAKDLEKRLTVLTN
ncbi:unnamed protein product, partial [Meganyctiphanes norvegica]